MFITKQPEHTKHTTRHWNMCKLQRHLWKLSTKAFILAVGSTDVWVWQMLLCPSRVPSDSGQSRGSLLKRRWGRKKKAVLICLVFFESNTLFASPQAVILADLKLSRARPGLVIAQKNPQPGKKKLRLWNKECEWLTTRLSFLWVRGKSIPQHSRTWCCASGVAV